MTFPCSRHFSRSLTCQQLHAIRFYTYTKNDKANDLCQIYNFLWDGYLKREKFDLIRIQNFRWHHRIFVKKICVKTNDHRIKVREETTQKTMKESKNQKILRGKKVNYLAACNYQLQLKTHYVQLN